MLYIHLMTIQLLNVIQILHITHILNVIHTFNDNTIIKCYTHIKYDTFNYILDI